MYCKSCGNQIPDGSLNCQYCGADQNQPKQNSSIYETGEMPVAPVFTPNDAPQPSKEPENKNSKGILIGIIAALVVALLAVLFIFVIKPKIDAKKNPNSSESTTVVTTNSLSIETPTKRPEMTTEEGRTGNEEKTTLRESATKSEKTSKKDESEKKDTNSQKENSDKKTDSSNAVDLPPEVNTDTQYTKLEEAYVTLDNILYTIEWGSDAEVKKLFDQNVYFSNAEDKQMAWNVVQGTIPYFTYDIWAYEQIDENTYDFYIDVYTLEFYDVADAFVNEALAYADYLYWYGYETAEEDVESELYNIYFESLYYIDHSSVIVSTYVTMSYVNGKWQINSVEDIFDAMLCDFAESLDYAYDQIEIGLEELNEYYANDYIYYDDPSDVYI